MQKNLCRLVTNQRGFILYLSIILMGLLSIIGLGYATVARVDVAVRDSAAKERDSFYAAEAGLNVGMAEYRNIFDNYGIPTGSDFDPRTLTLGNRTVEYELDPVPGTESCTDGIDPDCFVAIPQGEKFAGLNALQYRYTILSTAINQHGQKEVNLGAEFDVHNIPIFQFAAFYAKDLEILPGPDMNLHGRIHTNGDLYLNAGSTLTISDMRPEIPSVQVSSAGDIYRGRKEDTSCDGTVIIDKIEDIVAPPNDYDPLTLACNGGSAPVPPATIAAYLGSVYDQIDPLEIPPVDDIARGGSGVYWQNADLRIVLRLDQPRAAINFGAAGLCPGGPGDLTSPALYPIEVQDANGSPNAAKTQALLRFMCERRGSIFYNDVPTGKQPDGVGSAGDSDGRDASDYTPIFSGMLTGNSDGSEHNDPNYRVYRRVGEDTNGDGVINNTDWNLDVCPVSITGGALEPICHLSGGPATVFVAAASLPGHLGHGDTLGPCTAPVSTPSYCPWPNPVTAGNETRWFRDTDYRRGAYYNHRESKYMYLLNVNMRALIEWNESNADALFPANDATDGGLVIFLSVQGADSTASDNNYGVRVFDSADLDTRNNTFPPSALDPTGLTVVSDQAVYVQGNYNTVDKYPAAFLADSLNVLSQSWERPITAGGDIRANDRKSLDDFTDFRTVQVQDAPCGPAGCGPNLSYGINAAFLAGVDDTIGSAYNGGLENYPRFHERWNGRTLVYRGSLVSLGNPQHVDGSWSYGGPVYEAPGRDWDYDGDFNLVQKLPPLSPKVTYLQQKMFTRLYK